MQPTVRTSPRRWRIALALALPLCAARPASGGELECAVEAALDPRIEALRKFDPDDPRIEITSDTGELGRAGDARLSGNVQVRMGQRLLSADAAEIDAEQRTVQLEGDVEFLDPTLRVTGQGGNFSPESGQFRGAEFQLLEESGRGSASNVRLRDRTVLELEGVRYTACPPGSEDWHLAASSISIDQETLVGTGRDVRLDFKGVPILYTPWISFPVGDARKSGFLFPTVGSGGQTGTQITVPYYWNIAPQRDATLTTRYFSKRGLRLDPEFRYLTPRSNGEIEAEYVVNDLVTDEARAFFDGRHVTHLEPLTRLLVDAAYASDDEYFEDYGVGFEGTSVTFLDQLAEARSDTDHWSLVGRVQSFQVLDQALPDDEEPYSRLPQLVARGQWRDFLPGAGATVYAEAVNFGRDTGVEGVRVDVEPGLGWRRDANGAYAAAAATFRSTAYSLTDSPTGDDSPVRNLPTFSLDSGLLLERDAGSRGQRLQTLEPRALYLYVPYRDQDELPVFDTAVPDLNLVQLFRTNRYVGADRVGDANQLSLGVTSRLLDARGGRQFLSATLGQAFYFEDPRVRLPDEPASDRSASDVVAEVEMSAFKNWNARVGYQWDPDAGQSEKSELYLQYRPASDQVINAGYRYRRDLLEQFDVSAAWPINERWRGFGRWVYSLSEEKTLDQFVGIEYGSCCWALRVVTRRFVSSRTGDSDTSIGLQLELKGLSSVGVDYEAFLSGAIRGYSAIPPDSRP